MTAPIPLPAYGPIVWIPAPVGDSEEALGSWLLTDAVVDTVATGGVNQQMGHTRSLSSSMSN